MEGTISIEGPELKFFLMTELASNVPEREASGESEEALPEIPLPAVLGGLMVSENVDLNTAHARIRSGNFKLHQVEHATGLALAIAAAELAGVSAAAADDTEPSAETGAGTTGSVINGAVNDPELREL